MTYRTLFLSLALTVLIVQLVSLDAGNFFVIKGSAYGDVQFVEKVKRTTTKFKRILHQSVYSARKIEEYESIVFVGDIMLARNVEEIMKREGSDYPFSGLDLTSLGPNSAVIGNFESSMSTEHVQTPVNNLKFSVNPLLLSGLENAGFTHLSLGNNHSDDYGNAGYSYTKRSLAEINIETFGHENYVSSDSITYLDTVSGKVALIAVNASDGKLKKAQLFSVMQEAAENSQIQIIYIHWGLEYDTIHHSSQRNLAEDMVAHGADLIVGHHPHVTQDIEMIGQVPVIYSLGNYIFDQYFADNVQKGLVLLLELQPEPKLHLLPVSSLQTLSQPTIMQPQQYAEALEKLAEKSEEKLKESIFGGVIPLYKPVASSSKTAMMI